MVFYNVPLANSIGDIYVLEYLGLHTCHVQYDGVSDFLFEFMYLFIIENTTGAA